MIIVLTACLALFAIAQTGDSPIIAPQLASMPLSNRIWHFDAYSFANADVPKQIAKVVEKQLYPTGIEVQSGDSLNMVYGKVLGIGSNDCRLTVITDLKAVDATIQNDIIAKGYLPTDISVTPKGIYVVYIPSPVKILAWRIFVTKGIDLELLKKEQAAYADQGFATLGLSAYEGNFWSLMVKADRPLFPAWTIKGYKNDGESFIKGIEYQASTGSLPLGFAVWKDMIYAVFSTDKK